MNHLFPPTPLYIILAIITTMVSIWVAVLTRTQEKSVKPTKTTMIASQIVCFLPIIHIVIAIGDTYISQCSGDCSRAFSWWEEFNLAIHLAVILALALFIKKVFSSLSSVSASIFNESPPDNS